MAETKDLQFLYGGVASNGGSITEQVADSATANTLTDSALTEADDYWNGAILRFEDDTLTSALQGLHYHVTDFDAETDTLTVKPVFAATPAANDTYKLLQVAAGNYISAEEMPGLTVDSGASNITGVTIDFVSHGNTDANGTLSFINSSTSATWQAGADSAAGSAVDISSNGTYTLKSDTEDCFIEITVVSASLPTSDQSDTIQLSTPSAVIVPNTEAEETVDGFQRHTFGGIKNNAADAMESLKVYVENGASTAAATTTTAVKDKTAGTLTATSLSNWPTTGWIHNTTENDCAYFYNRSGNTVSLLARNDACKLAFDAGSAEISVGDTVVGATSAASGVVVAIQINSGTWGGSDAAGYLYLKDFNGTSYTDDENLQVSAATKAVANGAQVTGYREHTAADWSSGDSIELMPDFDIAIDAPSTNQFEAPASESIQPAGLTFSCPNTATDGLSIASIAASGIYGLWFREVIPEGARAQSTHEPIIKVKFE